MSEPSAISGSAECARAPATNTRPSLRPASGVSPPLTDASRLLEGAYPNLSLHYDDDRLYVMEKGTLYHVRLNSDRDGDTGYAAMTLTYVSKHDAAIDSGRQPGDNGCTSAVELVVARMGASGTPDIVARGRLDAEAVAVDVRTLAMTSDMDGPLVRLFYFAYYGNAEWFGFVGFRSDVTFAGGRLETNRLPASYLKVTKPGMQRMEGAIGPAGGGAGNIRFMTMAFGDQGEVEREFVVPLVGAGSVSGIEVLRRVPADTGPSTERPGMSVDDRAPPSADRLLGSWRIERAEGGIDGTTPTEIEFLPGGLADYCVHVGGGWHVIPLVFRIEGDVLVMHPRPPMVPEEERSRIRFEPDGALVMEHGGRGRVWLRRAERRAPRDLHS
jgi:hypothetical protein